MKKKAGAPVKKKKGAPPIKDKVITSPSGRYYAFQSGYENEWTIKHKRHKVATYRDGIWVSRKEVVLTKRDYTDMFELIKLLDKEDTELNKIRHKNLIGHV